MYYTKPCLQWPADATHLAKLLKDVMMFLRFFYMYRIYFLALFYKKRLKFPRRLYMEFLDISNIYICIDTNTEKFAKNKVKTSNIASPVYTTCLLVRYYCSTFSPKTLHVIHCTSSRQSNSTASFSSPSGLWFSNY